MKKYFWVELEKKERVIHESKTLILYLKTINPRERFPFGIKISFALSNFFKTICMSIVTFSLSYEYDLKIYCEAQELLPFDFNAKLVILKHLDLLVI